MGELTRHTVMSVDKVAHQYFDFSKALQIGCADISLTDSAGVALLIEWSARANKQGGSIQFSAFPPQMKSIIEISHMSSFFGTQQE